jgi:penicillin-binding protein-related factor A (putative recombinase)
MNSGKKFEKKFKDSIPEDVFYYRFKDSPATYDMNDKSRIRFATSNICDCLVIYSGISYFFELKNIKGPSIPFGNFRENQINYLTNAVKYNGIEAGFIVNFEKYDRTYFMDIQLFNKFVEVTDRKSIPIKIFEEHCQVIRHIKTQRSYKLDIKDFLNNH